MGVYNTMIPKIIMQISIEKPETYLLSMIHDLFHNWEYMHFIDSGDDVFAFFENHPMVEFKDISSIYRSFSNGAHRADLFRYYFLYINGGVYLDSDAMISRDIHGIINNYSFVTIRSYHENDSLIFNGFICTEPKNQIIYKALKSMYNMNKSILDTDYFYICRKMFEIISLSNVKNIMMYRESKPKFYNIAATTYDQDGKKMVCHYRFSKRIPDTAKNITAYVRNARIYSGYLYHVVKNIFIMFGQRLKASNVTSQ
jgi:mannosyltransferase OCH1-like enzyme